MYSAEVNSLKGFERVSGDDIDEGDGSSKSGIQLSRLIRSPLIRGVNMGDADVEHGAMDDDSVLKL